MRFINLLFMALMNLWHLNDVELCMARVNANVIQCKRYALSYPAMSADIRCYSCSTQAVGTLYAERCGDDFRLIPRDASKCAAGGTCMKSRGYRTEGTRRVVEVTRSCVPYRADGCEDGSHNGISTVNCYCNTEYCNSAGFIRGSLTLCITLLGTLLGAVYIFRT